MADLDTAPSHLLQFVRCKCKTENKRSSKCRGKSCKNNDTRDLIFISHFCMVLGQFPPSSKPNPNPNPNPNRGPIYSGAIAGTPSILMN